MTHHALPAHEAPGVTEESRSAHGAHARESPERPGRTGLGRPRVVIAVDLPEPLCQEIQQQVPEVDVVRDHTLYRPRQGPADWSGDPDHSRTPEQQRAYEAMVDSADVLFSLPDVDPAQLARTVRANPRLRWVQAMAAGGGSQLRAAGLEAAELERVAVTTSAGVHGSPLAEFALFGVLAGAKTLPRLTSLQRDHHWGERWEMRQLAEMTVLVLGLGGIGRACAQMFSALGSRVLGSSRSGTPVPHVEEIVPMDELPEAISRADAVVLTLPGTTSTDGLVDQGLLESAAPGTILVNVGRGTVVDEDALVGALDDGRIGFAALDVTATEPLPADSPLWDHPNVLISPHTAALSSAEEARIVELFIDNLRRHLEGRELRNVVDTVEFY
ncbi:D-2-hydroxyacid dehydrogenase [Brachybacterium fresconis]|uniref:Phosphoglycerate dehydrogenase-like enzyme n=1 Tax=Brachybacterium fresconis TaxID=173363 RepID=A0ABS4YIS4_9MICO|nr:D-2-hydroxyacid dehydrogenase [Brachybacterium fresconis]MBP2408707.1 phosphoglycerate dehydrogenase-like enzyme [Brachybacterium fresconis]